MDSQLCQALSIIRDLYINHSNTNVNQSSEKIIKDLLDKYYEECPGSDKRQYIDQGFRKYRLNTEQKKEQLLHKRAQIEGGLETIQSLRTGKPNKIIEGFTDQIIK